MHDVNGTKLKIGDKVAIIGVIKSLSEGNPDFCNVEVETFYGRRPDGHQEKFSAINTAQLLLLEKHS